MRNLTYDFVLSHLQAERDSALAAISEFEVVTLDVPKRDKAGKVVVDEDGVPTLVTKRLLKRDVVAAQWVDKLKPHEERAHDRY